MRCKTKQRKGSRPAKNPRVSSHAAEMRMEARTASVFLKTVELVGARQKNWGWKINDHPREQSRRQNSAYRHRNRKGAFGNEGALRFYQATDGRRLDFLRKSGSTFSTSASAVMACFLRRIGTAPCSMN